MSLNLSCPVPSNINPLSSNGFNFFITKLPEVSFWCQEVNLPSMTLPAIEFNTPLSMLPITGDIIQYEDLNIQFLVDENMANYSAIYNWMIGLGFPESNKQYSDYISSQKDYTRLSRESSDATLQILGSNNQPIKIVRFVDILPTNLSSMTFQSTNTDVNYIVGNATFRINRYEFE